METLYGLPFKILQVPNLRLKRPSWLKKPSAMFMYTIVTISYFLVTGGKHKIQFYLGTYLYLNIFIILYMLFRYYI